MHKLLLKLCGNLADKVCNSFTMVIAKFLKTAASEIGTKSVLPTLIFFLLFFFILAMLKALVILSREVADEI